MAIRIVAQKNQLKDRNAVVTTLIGDDDATTINHVRRESAVPVEKWSDLNHVEKAFSSALYDLKVRVFFVSINCSSRTKCIGVQVQHPEHTSSLKNKCDLAFNLASLKLRYHTY